MIETRWTLFNGPAGEDRAHVWLEAQGGGLVLSTDEWGPGVERNFGFDTIETWLCIDAIALATLAAALVLDDSELDSSAPAVEIVAAAYRGDSAASAYVRGRLEELGLDYDFTMR